MEMSIGVVRTIPGDRTGWLDRKRTVADASFNRWLVPPAALAIHLCIGMAYGLSVFWLPLSHALGGEPAPACRGMSIVESLFTTSCDWPITALLPIFGIGIVFLGLSAAMFGGWLEREGPRKAAFVAALCWSGGFFLSAFGVYIHQLWLLWMGLGVVGGIGLGLGYISPVSTLIKWFPDRRGMATGMAIMGFGGGAMIGSPLANLLIANFKSPSSIGVWETMVVLGAVYLVVMMAGAFGYRVPPAGWSPPTWTPTTRSKGMIALGHVELQTVHKTPQFWLVWAVLCCNVTAGIGVLAMASPMLQEIFGGTLIGQPEVGFGALDPAGKAAIATVAAGFVGLLSLFNIGGRFFWASMSDRIGRKTTYFVFFALGIVLYAAAPHLAEENAKALFVAAFCVILSMYGGGFATVPAYLADLFGTQFVGAIHGRLLTAWSAAGVFGPLLIGYLRDTQLAAGVDRAHLYNRTMYILAGILALGAVCNALIRPVARRWFENERGTASDHRGTVKPTARTAATAIARPALNVKVVVAWLVVCIPIAWGVSKTFASAVIIFQ